MMKFELSEGDVKKVVTTSRCVKNDIGLVLENAEKYSKETLVEILKGVCYKMNVVVDILEKN